MNGKFSEFSLMDYHARFYSPTIGKFTQPDTIIPSLTNSQSWNRYSYVNNSPIMYIDPSGHYMEQACEFGGGDCGTVGDPPDNQDSVLDTGFDQPGDIDEGLESDGNPDYGICERYYGVEACKGWNYRFRFDYYWDGSNTDIYWHSFNEVFGLQELNDAGQLCANTLTSDYCDNPFWSEYDRGPIEGDHNYSLLLVADNVNFRNPLMEFVLREVGADPNNMANWDPAWIMAISVNVDASVLLEAKNEAFMYYHANGYMVEWGNERLDDLAHHQKEIGGLD